MELSLGRTGSRTTYKEYSDTLGPITEGEPVVVVRVSKTGETDWLSPGAHDVVLRGSGGEPVRDVSVIEMPEAEFYFFRAFREGIFDFQRELYSAVVRRSDGL
jgi:hypothetical protein